MPNASLMQRWFARFPIAVAELKSVIGVSPLPEGIVLEEWEIKVITAFANSTLSTLMRTNPAANGGRISPGQWGELIGTGALLLNVAFGPTEASESLVEEIPEVVHQRELLESQVSELLGSQILPVLPGLRLPALQAHREFAAGYVKGLNSLFEDDGVTMKQDTEKKFLLFLFWMHREELKPKFAGNLSHVHKWVNEVSMVPVSLANLRKVANEVGLKLAEPGHPAAN